MMLQVDIGLFEGSISVDIREKAYGVQFQHVLQFQSIFKLDYSQVNSYVSKGYNFILNIQFDDNNGEGVWVKSVCSSLACHCLL